MATKYIKVIVQSGKRAWSRDWDVYYDVEMSEQRTLHDR